MNGTGILVESCGRDVTLTDLNFVVQLLQRLVYDMEHYQRRVQTSFLERRDNKSGQLS